jgi:hypothetical protein
MTYQARARALYCGQVQTPLVGIVPDHVYPNLWRMHWPDRRVSDLCNLTRIMDAALAICERGPPERDRRSLHWKKKSPNSPSGARGAGMGSRDSAVVVA